MVGVIILYDYVHPAGAFVKSSKIDVCAQMIFSSHRCTHVQSHMFIIWLLPACKPYCVLQMKGCIKVLRDQPPNRVEGLLNALRSVNSCTVKQYSIIYYIKILFLLNTYSGYVFKMRFWVCSTEGTRQNIWTMRLPPSKSKTCYKSDSVHKTVLLENLLRIWTLFWWVFNCWENGHVSGGSYWDTLLYDGPNATLKRSASAVLFFSPIFLLPLCILF